MVTLTLPATESLLGRPEQHLPGGLLESVLHGRRVLITGAAGTIGSELVRVALDCAAETVIALDQSENGLVRLEWSTNGRRDSLQPILHNICDPRATRRLFDKLEPSVVFHAAAYKHVPVCEADPASAVKNNVFGTLSVVEAAHYAGVPRLCLISTDKAASGCCVMGATKRLAECVVRCLGRPGWAAVRFGNVLGSAASVLELWERQVRHGEPITLTDPEMTRYLMTCREGAELAVGALAVNRSCGGIDRSSPEMTGERWLYTRQIGEPVRLVDLAARFLAGHNVDVDPAAVSFIGPRPGERQHETMTAPQERLAPCPPLEAIITPEPSAPWLMRALDDLRRSDAMAATVLRLAKESFQP